MQKTLKYTFCYFPAFVATVILTQNCYAATLEKVTNSGIDSCEVWKASSNDYTFMQFLSDVFIINEQSETNKEVTSATPPKTDNSHSNSILQTFNQPLVE